MEDSTPFLPSREEVRARYAVRLLADARVTDRGVVHREGGAEVLLEWAGVQLNPSAYCWRDTASPIMRSSGLR